MEVVVLGSGSAGNATLIRSGDTCLLVDAGLSAKQLEARLAIAGVDPSHLCAVLLTHEHADHTAGIKVFAKRWQTPLYCNPATARALDGRNLGASIKLFETGSSFAVGDLTVRSFSVPHDASDPVGFRIDEGTTAFGVLTDLGYATRLVMEALRDVRGLLIETNYDEALLQNDTKRPWSVKQRIASRHGHLSNAAAAEVIAKLEAPDLQALILCHLSRDCNSPELATGTIGGRLAPRTPRVVCASQDCPTPAISVH